MDKSTNQLGVIAENYNELKDLLDLALDFIKINKDYSIKVLSTSKIYNDFKAEKLLLDLKKHVDVFFLPAPKNKTFSQMNAFEKLLYVYKVKRDCINFFSDVNFVLSGIQIIFERIIYNDLRKKECGFWVYSHGSRALWSCRG